MKQITAQELVELISNAPRTYWRTHTFQESRTREEYIESSVDRCFDGWGGWSAGTTTTVYYSEDVTTYTLNLAKLLSDNGYDPRFYPLRFSLPEKHNIDYTGCSNLFDSNILDEKLFEEVKWCFKNYYLMEQNEVSKIIQRLSKEQLIQLYQKNDVDSRCKDLIFKRHPDIDPIRQAKEKIQTLFSSVDSLKQQKKQDANWLAQLRDYYDKIYQIFQHHISGEDKSYFNTTLKKIVNGRFEIAKKAYSLKEYELAENLYSQLIEQHIKNLNSIIYVKRAKIFYFLHDFEKALADLNQYGKLTKEKAKTAEYHIWLALVMTAKEHYDLAANAIHKIAMTVDKTNNRKQFFNQLPKENITHILTELLHNAENEELEKDRKIFEEEYIAYLTLAAEANDAEAQFKLSQMLWESDRFQAEMWLGRAAANHYAEAQHRLAEVYNERLASNEGDVDYNFAQMKNLLKQSAVSEYKLSKDILATFYSKMSESYKTETPNDTSAKKRKALEESITEHEIPFTVAPPFKLQCVEESPLDIFLDAHNPGKRVRIPDTTALMANQVEQAFEKDKSEKKRNYVAANLTIIFADNVKKEERTARLTRTISITADMTKGHVNIQTLFGKEKNGRLEYDVATVNERHKSIIQNAQSGFQKISNGIPKEDKDQLNFIPSTAGKIHNPNTHLHSEYALYQYLITGDNFSKLLDKFAQKNASVFKKGCKVYGVVIDLYTSRASCTDCKKVTFSLQNQGELLQKIQKAFHDKGYACLTKRKTGLWNEGKLHLLVRIRAGQKYKNKSDKFADNDIIPSIKNLKTLNNQFFFHIIEKPSINTDDTQDKYLLFESGTNAIRPQK